MKAAIISAPRIPITIEEIDISKPIDREVLVRTAVSGVCHSDLHYVDRPAFEPYAVLDRSRTPGPPSSRMTLAIGPIARNSRRIPRMIILFTHPVFDAQEGFYNAVTCP